MVLPQTGPATRRTAPRRHAGLAPLSAEDERNSPDTKSRSQAARNEANGKQIPHTTPDDSDSRSVTAAQQAAEPRNIGYAGRRADDPEWHDEYPDSNGQLPSCREVP